MRAVEPEFEKLRGLVQQSKDANGAVDVGKLEQKIDSSGDPRLRRGLEAIEDGRRR